MPDILLSDGGPRHQHPLFLETEHTPCILIPSLSHVGTLLGLQSGGEFPMRWEK